MEKLDKTDHMILDFLQKDARMPIKEIAKQVYLSSPAVTARIEKLEKNGYIHGYHATVDMVKLGYYVTAFINLAMDPIRKKEFYPYIEKVKNVVECACVTGEYSMLIKVCFRTTQELDVFVTDLQRFGATQTQIVFSTNIESRGVMTSERSDIK